jgi:hypothetical protein
VASNAPTRIKPDSALGEVDPRHARRAVASAGLTVHCRRYDKNPPRFRMGGKLLAVVVMLAALIIGFGWMLI